MSQKDSMRVFFTVKTGTHEPFCDGVSPDFHCDDAIDFWLIKLTKKIDANTNYNNINLKVYLKDRLDCLVAIRRNKKWFTTKGQM